MIRSADGSRDFNELLASISVANVLAQTSSCFSLLTGSERIKNKG